MHKYIVMLQNLGGNKLSTIEINELADKFKYSECDPVYVFWYACIFYFQVWSEFRVVFFPLLPDHAPELQLFYADY